MPGGISVDKRIAHVYGLWALSHHTDPQECQSPSDPMPPFCTATRRTHISFTHIRTDKHLHSQIFSSSLVTKIPVTDHPFPDTNLHPSKHKHIHVHVHFMCEVLYTTYSMFLCIHVGSPQEKSKMEIEQKFLSPFYKMKKLKH